MATRTLSRRPLAWPFKMLGWCAVLVLGLAAAVGAAVIGAGTYYEITRTKAGDLERKIEKALPLGTAADQVIGFLDSEGIEHGPVEPSRGDDRKLQEIGIPMGTMVIAAMVENDGYSPDLVDVHMRFILNADLKLVDYLVYETHRRP